MWKRTLAGQDVQRRRPVQGRPHASLPHGEATERADAAFTAASQNGRVAGELSVYRVVATVTASINEDDGDIHLALRGEDGATLIAEAPEPACSVNARDRAAIDRARLAAQDIKVGNKVIAVGVGFFDFAHKQTGHANNYLELHALLALKSVPR